MSSSANLDAGELRRHEERAGDCKRLLENSGEEALAAEGLAEEAVKPKRIFSVRSHYLQKEFFGGSTETNDDDLIAGRVFQLTECFQTRRSFCSCSARVRYGGKSMGESDMVGEESRVVK